MDAEVYIEIVKGLGPLGVLVGVVVYLLLRERNNKKAPNNPGNPYPGNPGPPLVNGRWQEQMKAGQDTTNATLERIEASMEESVKLLRLMEDRQQRE